MPDPRRVLFVTLLDDPGSDRIVAEMGRLGARCAVAGPAGSFAARSRFTSRLFPLPSRGGGVFRSLALAFRLARIAREWAPDMIFPLDDLAARALRDPRLYHRAAPGLRLLLEFSLGAPEQFELACSRQSLIAEARALGVRAPRQQVAPDLASAKRAAAVLGYPVVLKREQSCGGAGVAIVHDEAGLGRAFRRGRARAEAKRCLGWIPGFRLPERSPMSLQEFIRGDLAFRVSACANGRELEGVDFVAEGRDPGDTGASTRVRRIEHAEMREATRRVAAALRCSGVVSLDFIINEKNEAYLIEMNARPIASGHLGRLFGHDVYAAALGRGETMQEGSPPLASPPAIIALFPRELDRHPDSPHIGPPSAVHHDVPWDDPEIVAACAAWLDMRHPRHRPVFDIRAPEDVAPEDLRRALEPTETESRRIADDRPPAQDGRGRAHNKIGLRRTVAAGSRPL